MGGARIHGRVGSLGYHRDPLPLDFQPVDGVLGDGLSRHDHACGALHGELAQAQAGAGAQVLAAALQRGQVVERDDHRAGAPQDRPLHPRGVEQVELPRARLVGLEDLHVRGGGATQGFEQAARVAPDAATRIGGGASVVGDPHDDRFLAAQLQGQPRACTGAT